MGAFLSSPNSKNQPWEHGEALRPDSSKKQRLSSIAPCGFDHPRLIPGLPDEISLQILARMPRMGYLKAKMVSLSWKVAITGAELYRLRKDLGVDEEWLYILMKKEDDQKLVWHAFDPVSSQWQRLPLMPGISHGGECKRGVPGLLLGDLVSAGTRISNVIRGWLGQKDLIDRIPFCGCAIGMADGCLYVLGGLSRASAMKCVWRYDPFVNSWLEVSSMSTGRAFCKTSLLNNKLYVVGGVSKGKNGLTPLQSAEVFDPATGVWADVPNMTFSKVQALPTAFLAELLKPIAIGMTSYKGKLYVPQSLYSWPFFVDVGGEIFDPETNSWVEMPAGMGEGWPSRQAGTKLSAVVDGDLFALEPSTSSDRGKIKIYDPEEDTWKVAISQVPVGDFAESESPYLLAGFLGKLHLIIKDVDNTINILQTDSLKQPAPSAGTTCQNPDVSLEQETDIWKAIASKNFAAAELVSCQVLSI
ncbi:F-box/kelch-repeat protein At1g22040-like [Phragmites australis]|uniref:F-box/kelch-repeat protein At1g22040-like n=1 Tax=Phragmites australis TaxID=29695 RepID=UPI002D7731BC|nr:F-box/kelch-repeat protein At1g22040-like [Phragmites australis]XP_062200349.1 F-box/kelch-repeat protein At1g22040-like [Phragmites australis]XP_062200350.1 F-box/kelch-repeat protein At1g22040-like [Phragmites australis]